MSRRSNTMKRFISVLIILAMLTMMLPTNLFVVTVTATTATNEFAGGSGTESDPYLIKTKYHLDNVRNHLDAHFKMIADIEFTDADFAEGGDFYNDGQGFLPIGKDSYTPFTGVFDGNGYAIKNLYTTISSDDNLYVGLFGCNGGIIKNLRLVNSYVSATSSGDATYVGGIAGYNYEGYIVDCYNLGTVISDDFAGGIVGYNEWEVSCCGNSGSVLSYNYIGGIAGGNANSGSIAWCFNDGAVSSIYTEYTFSYAGGIIGANKGFVSNCHNSGRITGESFCSYAGGITGEEDSGYITSCYNTGELSTEISENGFSGGIIGCKFGTNNLYDCYYLNNVDKGVGEGIDTTTKCTTNEMTLSATFEDYDFENVWKIDSDISKYPILRYLHYHTYNDSKDASCDCGYERSLICTHVWPARGESNNDGTCNENGTWVLTCTVEGCGEPKTEEQPNSTVPHKYNNEDYVAYEPATCSKAGTEIASCAFCCGEINVRTNATKYPIDKDVHTFGDWIYNNDASCTKDGTETHSCGCGYSEDRVSPTYTAEVCGHTWGKYVYNGDASCTNDGTMTAKCTVDGCRAKNTIADPTFKKSPHTFGDYVYNNDATEQKDGTKTRTCSVCGHKETIISEGTKLEKTLVDSSKMFTDVPANKWFKHYVDYSVTYGIFTGTSDTTFSPNDNITRAQFVQVLANLEGVDTSNRNINSGFTDVPKGKWYTAAVTWAAKNGIVNGVGAGKFDPNANVTREQMCVMLVNYAKFKGITLKTVEAKENFADNGKISSWAKDAVYICQQSDIVNGKGAGLFDPKGTGTRAEASVIFTKFHKDFASVDSESEMEQQPEQPPAQQPEQPEDVLIISDATTLTDVTIDNDVYITSTGVVTFNNVTVNGNIYCYGQLTMYRCTANDVFAYAYGSMFTCDAFDGVHGKITGGITCNSLTIRNDSLDYAFDKWDKQ